jgi:hypothetical protein
MPAVRYPQNFEMRTDAELTEEIKNAPNFSRAMLAQQYLETRFPIQEVKSAIMKLSVQIDPYFNLDAKDVMALVASGIAEKWKAVMHFEIEAIVKALVEEDEAFLDKPMLEQKAMIEAKAKEMTPAVQNGLNVDAIIGAQ